MNATIGSITCPLCGNPDATVHEYERGSKRGTRYFRCYDKPGSTVMRCGTIQPAGFTGQEFIKRHMVAIAPGEALPPAPAPPETVDETPAPAPIGQKAPESPAPARKPTAAELGA